MLINILLLEDNPGDRRLIQESLKEDGGNRFNLDWADRLSLGLQKLSAHKPDAIILDLSLPDSQGLDTFARVYAQAPDVPIVVLTGLKDEELAVQAVRAGAQDYLVKTEAAGGTLVRALLYGIERHRAEAARAHLAAIVESSNDAILSKSCEGVIQSWNRGAEKLYGYTAGEIIGQSVFLLSPQDRLKEAASFLHRVRRGERVENHETVRVHKDGRRIDVSVTMSPIMDASGRVIGASTIARDITERKRTEEKIRELNASLERRVSELVAANKELESFSYSVSHDLRAPLRAMDGFSQALLEDYADELVPEAKRYLQHVREASQRMDYLVNGILDLSRTARSEMQRTTVDMSALAETIALELKQAHPERRVEFVAAPRVVVNADGTLLRSALENLLGNAWKFTSQHARARIELGTMQQDGGTVYFVRDDGAGFDPAYANKLFGPFQRLHSPAEFPGTGIGLAIVQRIIERHGGRIWAEGYVELGATFFFTLG
jgi:PAS domain S-box-containing protein